MGFAGLASQFKTFRALLIHKQGSNFLIYHIGDFQKENMQTVYLQRKTIALFVLEKFSRYVTPTVLELTI